MRTTDELLRELGRSVTVQGSARRQVGRCEEPGGRRQVGRCEEPGGRRQVGRCEEPPACQCQCEECQQLHYTDLDPARQGIVPMETPFIMDNVMDDGMAACTIM